MSDTSKETIVHGVYSYNLRRLDENGDPKYAIVYLENRIDDVRLMEFDPIEDLNNIPELDYENDMLVKYLQVADANNRKLASTKLNSSETTKTATPNKLLYLDNAGKLQATVNNAENLGGVPYTKFAQLTDLEQAVIPLTHVTLTEFTQVSNLDNIPSVNYSSDTLLEFLRAEEAKVRKLNRDVLFASETTRTATANKILYLDADKKLQATAINADKATNDSNNQKITSTYIKNISVSGRTVTITRGDGTSYTQTTQDTTYTTMVGATASKAGVQGFVPAPAAGKQLSFLRADGTWVIPTDTKYSVFTGASSTAAGTSGLVPAPASGKNTSYLRGDGVWTIPTDTKYSAGTAITLSGTTFSNAGVRSIATGSSNGTISVNTNGTSANVSVKGLGSAAYTETSAYAAASHSHSQYALKTDIPAVWDSSGHLISPAGWKLWVEN